MSRLTARPVLSSTWSLPTVLSPPHPILQMRPTRKILVGAVLALSACGNAPPALYSGATLQATRDSTRAGIPLLELSHTLREVARGGVAAASLEPDLMIGGLDGPVGLAVDLASLGDGRFAVLDRLERQVVIFDSLGDVVARYGREGKGPGEYTSPHALAALGGGRLVVWQGDASATFTMLDTADGRVLATSPQVAKGDWSRPFFRGPLINVNGFQQGPEDVTRRLGRYGDKGFIHLLQENEHEYLLSDTPYPEAPESYLIRYDLDATLIDTVAVLTGPPTREQARLSDGYVLYQQPLFSGRPVWTVGEGWLALGHGDSTGITIRDFDGDTLLHLRLPERRERLQDHDRLEAARWGIDIRALNGSDYRRRIEEVPARELQREGPKYDVEHFFSFADSIPHLTAAYAADQCLFLAGYHPSDWPDGTALTWVAINVRTSSLEGVFRFEPPSAARLPFFDRVGAAVREFDRRYAYLTFRDDDGLSTIARYRLPELSCSTGAGL